MATSALLQDALIAWEQRTPGRTALVCGQARLTYRDLHARAAALAAEMQFRGMKRSDRVVVLLPNCPAAVVSIYGTLLAGGTFSVVNHGIKPGKLDTVLENCAPTFVITDAAGLRTLSAISHRLPRLGVFVTGEARLRRAARRAAQARRDEGGPHR